jgi:pseudaminic acid biosynthesis-associated methylase
MYKTPQENFWSGEFGNEYISRNEGQQLIAGNIFLFSQILRQTESIKSILEFGANIGLNLLALKNLLPFVETSGIEINDKAVHALGKNIDGGKVYHQSILDYKVDYKRDFVFTKGVLIHLNPEILEDVYTKLYESSSKYICVAEYYNPTPVEVNYRGHAGFLFKRDFAGEIMNQYSDLKLVDYGFVYKKDNNFPLDDITWFLMRKQ